MKPYYEHAGITIYHGDCREVMEEWEGLRTKSFDLLLTDPPYGIDADRNRGSAKYGWKDYEIQGGGWDKTPVEAETLFTAIRMANGAIVWGGNYYPLPPSMGWIVWDKCQREFSLADGELAWTSFKKATRIFSYSRATFNSDEERQHPTQKPEALMTWCIEKYSTGSILDVFMGSGTTLAAAKRLGRTATGIEIHEPYCEMAAKRLSQETLPLW